jgi:pimeloyl-ACP methyl ester carboxylesterase
MAAALPSPLGHAPDLRFRVVHGYRRAFRVAGAGPPVVLVHGIGDSSTTWDPARFVEVVEEFLDTTRPAAWSVEQWRTLLRSPAGAMPPEGAGERSAT